MLEVELPLRHRLSRNNMSGIMLLDGLSGTNFHYSISALSRVFEDVVGLTVIGMQTVEVCHVNGGTLMLFQKFRYKCEYRRVEQQEVIKRKAPRV